MSGVNICGLDGIPILKRLTALEPELAIPSKTESPTLELSEDEGYISDEKSVEVSLNTTIGGSIEMPVWIWLAIVSVCLAYLWGIAYALTPTRTVYP